MPATPLWAHIGNAAEAQGSGLPGCPRGFKAAAKAAAGVPCERSKTDDQGMPVSLRRAPSPDLLPAVYVAAAAAPKGCAETLRQYGATPAAVARGLIWCWEHEEDEAEASRWVLGCLSCVRGHLSAP